MALADCTADREFHPALKTISLYSRGRPLTRGDFDKFLAPGYNDFRKMVKKGGAGRMSLLDIGKENTCCFTGHRVQKLPWGARETDPRCVALRVRLFEQLEELYDRGIRHFICGMAQGSDMLFCEEALKLRDDRPGVTLEAALPCPQQSERWPESFRARYDDLLSRCDYVTCVSPEYTSDCMRLRNEYMVDHSRVLLAVYGGTFGGTMQTVNYARRSGLEVIIVEP